MDSRRVISSDKESVVHVWLAENATLLQTIQAPYKYLASTNNMKFAVRNFYIFHIQYFCSTTQKEITQFDLTSYVSFLNRSAQMETTH